MHHVYILYSKKLTLTYTGYTKDLIKRMNQHIETPTKTTSKAKDWILIWFATFKKESLAKAFEDYLKTGSGRAFISKRILSKVSNLEELSLLALSSIEM